MSVTWTPMTTDAAERLAREIQAKQEWCERVERILAGREAANQRDMARGGSAFREEGK